MKKVAITIAAICVIIVLGIVLARPFMLMKSFSNEETSVTTSGAATLIEAKSWEEKRELIMQEFDRVWEEVKQRKSDELKNASVEETNAILTPIVVERLTKELGVTEDEIFTAIRESE